MKDFKITNLLPIVMAVATGIGTTIAAIADHKKEEKIDKLIEKVDELTKK